MNFGLFRLSVTRPVFAIALNLLLVAIGLGAALTLPVREYPDIDPPVVSVRTTYLGASAEVVEREVTRTIEDNLSGISGVRVIRSITREESSTVIIEFYAGVDLATAAAEVRDQVSTVRRDLPDGAEEPIIDRASADDDPVMYISLASDRRAPAELTDIAERLMVDALGVVDGVSAVEVRGASRYAMRLWLDRDALAARGLTPVDVADRLRAENLELPAGRLDTGEQEITLRARTRLADADAFRGLVLREGDEAGGGRVLLGDVAEVAVGLENYRTGFRLNGQPAIALAVLRQSGANTLTLSDGIRAELDRLRDRLPPDVQVQIGSDESIFVRETLWNVGITLAITIGIVVVVVYLFLGSGRATLVPAVTIPAAIIPAAAVAAAFGYSINVLSVLATILAIGICVDDSVVIMENVRRRQQGGEPVLLAAARGTRQVGFAVLASTATLLAVILPLAFLGGNVGGLFAEFAVVLGATLVFSTMAAITLGPALSARLFRGQEERDRHPTLVQRWSDAAQGRVEAGYRRALHWSLGRPWIAPLAGVAFAALGVGAFLVVPAELAPDEDRGYVIIRVDGPEGAGFDYTLRQVERIEQRLADYMGEGQPVEQLLSIVGPGRRAQPQPNRAFLILRLAPWGERDISQMELVEELRGRFADVPGVRAFATNPAKLGQRGGGRQLRVAVAGVERDKVVEWSQSLYDGMAGIDGVVAPDTSHSPTRPQIEIDIDRDRASALGLDAAAVGDALRIMFGGAEVTRWLDRGEEYEVILQARPEDRSSPADLGNVFLRARGGELVPLTSIVTTREVGTVRELRRVDRLAAVEIGANLRPGFTLGTALEEVGRIVEQDLPPAAQIRYLGESLDYVETGSALYLILILVLLLTYLVLAMQFESFLHPAVVMAAAPLALAGGLLTLLAFGLTLNIYSQIAMVLLIGLVAKNGILLVEFANQLRDEGQEVREAAEAAAGLRLRPILMTTMATILGAVPLAVASGAGAESRSTIGFVIAFGLLLGTLLTLFVVPALYVLVGRHAAAPGARGLELARQEAARPEENGTGEPAPSR